jgi:hypothetical protein
MRYGLPLLVEDLYRLVIRPLLTLICRQLGEREFVFLRLMDERDGCAIEPMASDKESNDAENNSDD